MSKIGTILTNPLTIIAGCIAGIITAVYFPSLADTIKPIGSLYLTILKMCVLPIIISAIVSSTGKLLQKTERTSYVKKMLSLYAVFMLLSCGAGIIGSIATANFLGFGEDLRNSVGNLMVSNDSGSSKNSFQSVIYVIDSKNAPEKVESGGVLTFMSQLIPDNVFNSLSGDQTLQTVFFFLLFSIMIKFVVKEHQLHLISLSDAVFAVMQKLMQAILCFLPFGLWALLAHQFKNIDSEQLGTLGIFIIMVWTSSAVVLLASILVIWRTTGHGLLSQLTLLKAPILIALSTRSSFPTLPTALDALGNDMGLNKQKTNLSVSLGHTLCKYGKTMVFCIGSVFSLYLYQIPVTAANISAIFIISIFAGMAASGAPSIISRTMIVLVLAPLGVPSEAVIIIMLAVDPLTDPIITLVSTYPNYAVAAALSTADSDGNTQEEVAAEAIVQS